MHNNEENIDENYIRNLKTKGGFIMPENYFEQLQKSILNHIEIENYKIDGTKGGFQVESHFFEKQKETILNKIIKNNPHKIIPLYPTILFKVASIAALFIMIGFLILYKNSEHNIALANNTEYTNEEIINHLENTDVSEDLLCEVIDMPSKKNKESELEKYLIEHADEDLLIDEL